MKNEFCYDCLKISDRLTWDKGNRVCQNCYHTRYNPHKYTKRYLEPYEREPTFKNLKRYLEKKW